MNGIPIQIGDIIQINRFGYQHVGVYIGRHGQIIHAVVHNRKGEGIVVSSYEEFAAGLEVQIRQQATIPLHERGIIVQRALSLVGTKYDLINFNCEHAAYYAQSGVAQSPQVNNAVAGMAVGGLIFLGLAVASAIAPKKA